MHTQSGHPVQKRTSKYLKQYKEEQPGLLRMIIPIFQCYSYDAGLRMAHACTLEERRWVTKQK